MLQPITTVRVIQQSVKNVEQTDCQVTVFQYLKLKCQGCTKTKRTDN